MGKCFGVGFLFLSLFCTGAFYLWTFGEDGLIATFRQHGRTDDIVITAVFSGMTLFVVVATFLIGLAFLRGKI